METSKFVQMLIQARYMIPPCEGETACESCPFNGTEPMCGPNNIDLWVKEFQGYAAKDPIVRHMVLMDLTNESENKAWKADEENKKAFEESTEKIRDKMIEAINKKIDEDLDRLLKKALGID